MKSLAIQVQTSATIITGSPSEGAVLGDASIGARPLAGAGSAAYPTAALIRVPTGAQTVYFGGQGVTTTDGMPLEAGESLEVDLAVEILWAVTATTSQTVYVLRRGD